MAVAPSPIYEEVLKFLVSSPTPEQIIAFHAEEQAELDQFESVNHFVSPAELRRRVRKRANYPIKTPGAD